MKNIVRQKKRKNRIRLNIFLLVLLLLLSIVTIKRYMILQKEKVLSSTQPVTVSWIAFDGGGSRFGNNTQESILNASTVSKLVKLWQVTLPNTADSSPVSAENVTTPTGIKNLLFLTSKPGSIFAIDQSNGALVWRKDTTGSSGVINSSPAVDPSGNYVYSFGKDSKIHKYAIGDGTETIDNTWPVTISLLSSVEKGSSAINIANGYLYMSTSGYYGDGGHYEGHVVAVNLATNAVTVWNSLCANITQLLGSNTGSSNYCQDVQSGIWGRATAVLDPVSGNIYVVTGNGDYNANTGGQNYGDSIIELSPDLTKIIDTYTPDTYATLQADDLDLGSTAPLMLPKQSSSKTPYMAVQGGKDNVLRLVNRQNLSGQGGPNHIGGELQTVTGINCDIDFQPVAWNDANNLTWVFVSDTCGNFYAYTLTTNGSGVSSLQLKYTDTYGGSSPFIANNIIYMQDTNVVRAIDPATGNVLWASTNTGVGGTTGGLHWQSPIVIHGNLYVPDNSGKVTAYALPNTQTPTPTTGLTLTPTRIPTATPTIVPSVTPTPAPLYDLSGIVYIDSNGNGVQDAGEVGFQTGANITLSTGESTASDITGMYDFPDLPLGTYTLTLTVPTGYSVTTANPLTVALSSNYPNAHFGLKPLSGVTPTLFPTLTPTLTPIPSNSPTSAPSVLTPTQSLTPTSGPSLTPTPVIGNGDTNNDGQVNASDIENILGDWLKPPVQTTDQYQDTVINSLDFTVVLEKMQAMLSPSPGS